jgi:hypothetical protein
VDEPQLTPPATFFPDSWSTPVSWYAAGAPHFSHHKASSIMQHSISRVMGRTSPWSTVGFQNQLHNQHMSIYRDRDGFDQLPPGEQNITEMRRFVSEGSNRNADTLGSLSTDIHRSDLYNSILTSRSSREQPTAHENALRPSLEPDIPDDSLQRLLTFIQQPDSTTSLFTR